MPFDFNVSKPDDKADFDAEHFNLFGYISKAEQEQCKSWQWLKEHYKDEFSDIDYFYNIPVEITMGVETFNDFIKLYIEDYNKFSPFKQRLTLKNFEDELKPGDDVLVRWG